MPTVSIGAILSKAVAVFKARASVFIALGLIGYLPTLLFADWSARPHPVMGNEMVVPAAEGLLGVLGMLVGFVVQFLITAALVYTAFQATRGRPVGIGDSLGAAAGRLLPVIALSLLAGLGVVVGFALLIIPGLFLLTVWSVAVPACVLENTGPIRSLGRSYELTKGHRWSVFGLLILVMLLGGVLQVGLGMIGGVAAAAPGAAVATYIGQAVIGAFGAAVSAMLYHDLRAAKEGVDTDTMVATFD